MTSDRLPGLRAIYDGMLKKNRNVFFLFYSDGKSGVGKSYLALSIAEALDPSFGIDRVCFTLEDFIRLVSTLPPKTIVVYDDAGVESDSRSFLSKKNKILRYTIESMRVKLISVFFTVPGLDMIESTVRTMATLQFRVKEHGLAKVYGSKFNQYHQKYYFPGLFWVGDPHNNRKRVPRPSDALIAAYEAKKADTLITWYGGFLGEIDGMKRKALPKMSDLDIALDIEQKGVDPYLDRNGKLDIGRVALEYKCSVRKIELAQKILRSKGLVV